MNAVEESMRETLDSWTSSKSLTYKERQSLKQYDIRQQMLCVLTKMRRFERLAWWWLVTYVVLTLVMSVFNALGVAPFGSFIPFLGLCLGLINRGQMLRDASVTLAKMETLADLWLRQNGSSLAEFDRSNKAAVKLQPQPG